MRTLKLETEMCEEPDLIRGLRPRLQPLAEAARLHLTHSSALDLPSAAEAPRDASSARPIPTGCTEEARSPEQPACPGAHRRQGLYHDTHVRSPETWL